MANSSCTYIKGHRCLVRRRRSPRGAVLLPPPARSPRCAGRFRRPYRTRGFVRRAVPPVNWRTIVGRPSGTNLSFVRAARIAGHMAFLSPLVSFAPRFFRPSGAGSVSCSRLPRLAPLRLRSGQAVGCILSPLREWGVAGFGGRVESPKVPPSFARLSVVATISDGAFRTVSRSFICAGPGVLTGRGDSFAAPSRQ